MENRDDFLTQFRETPRPEFGDELYERINRAAAAPRRASVWSRPAFVGAGALAALVVLFSFPAVRAAAQDFLDLFRVKRFVAVSVDPERLEQLRTGKVSVESLLAESVEELTPRRKPRVVETAERASEMAGIPVLVPTFTNEASVAPEIVVEREHATRITADADRLRSTLDALGIDDVAVPDALDGAQVTLHVPAAVKMRYIRDNSWVATLTQARSPEIDLPAGVDLAVLGEIALRISGMSAEEASDFAIKVDWHGTLLVPVPANAGSFREVDVRGTTGLLIAVDNRKPVATDDDAGPRDTPRTILLWTENGMIYGLASSMHPVDVIEMANSLRNG